MDLRVYLDVLRAGGVVACPTETQMGLLADALNERAVERVSFMKKRAKSEPIALIAPSLQSALGLVGDVSARALELATLHWPGPLTLVLRARAGLSPLLLKDGNVALRVPGPSPAFDLVKAFGSPLTATSANVSGQEPLCTEAALRSTFGTALSAIVPGTPSGTLPSTIVDMTGEHPIVLRQGALTLAL